MKLRPTIAGRVIAAAFALAIGFSIYRTSREALLVFDSRSWPAVDGRVLGFVPLEPRPRSGYPELDIVRYEYLIQGDRYVGRRVSYSRRTKWYQEDLRSLMVRHPERSAVKVHFNPADPAESVLEPGGALLPSVAMLGLQFCVFVFAFWWLLQTKP